MGKEDPAGVYRPPQASRPDYEEEARGEEHPILGRPFGTYVEMFRDGLRNNPARAKSMVLVHLTGVVDDSRGFESELGPGAGAGWALFPAILASACICNGAADSVLRLPDTPEKVEDLPRSARNFLVSAAREQ